MLLCMHIASFALQVARRHHGIAASDEPALLADKPDRGRIIDLDERAYALGARRGQTVLQASAATGGAQVFVHDSAHSHAVWNDMLDALDAVSPLIDDTAEGTAYLEMRGIDGDAQAWMDRARAAVAPFGLPARMAIGPNKFVTRAATYAGDGTTCSEEEGPALLAPLPLEMLDLDCRTIDRLQLLGIKTLGELAQLPHGPFVRRFGSAAKQWHDRARAIDPTPLRPRAHELQIDAAAYGEGSAAQAEQVYFALRILTDRVCSDLERAGRSAATVRLSLQCENGDTKELDVGFAQATADPRLMLDVMRAKLEGMAFGAPIDGLRLQAMRLEEGGVPAPLFGQSEPDSQALGLALTRLEAAVGTPGRRARVVPAHRLENRFQYDSFAPPLRVAGVPPATRAHPVPQLRMLAVREIRVAMRRNVPEVVEARHVVECAGPWRLDDGWFESPVARDEYDVLLDDGLLWRIYRQGERWYLRGAYD